jgi:hypothetical protein
MIARYRRNAWTGRQLGSAVAAVAVLTVVAVLVMSGVSARKIEDSRCEAETVDIANDHELHDRLQALRVRCSRQCNAAMLLSLF